MASAQGLGLCWPAWAVEAETAFHGGTTCFSCGPGQHSCFRAPLWRGRCPLRKRWLAGAFREWQISGYLGPSGQSPTPTPWLLSVHSGLPIHEAAEGVGVRGTVPLP